MWERMKTDSWRRAKTVVVVVRRMGGGREGTVEGELERGVGVLVI